MQKTEAFSAFRSQPYEPQRGQARLWTTQKSEANSHRRSQPETEHSRVVGLASSLGWTGASCAIQELVVRRSRVPALGLRGRVLMRWEPVEYPPHQRPMEMESSFDPGSWCVLQRREPETALLGQLAD